MAVITVRETKVVEVEKFVPVYPEVGLPSKEFFEGMAYAKMEHERKKLCAALDRIGEELERRDQLVKTVVGNLINVCLLASIVGLYVLGCLWTGGM